MHVSQVLRCLSILFAGENYYMSCPPGIEFEGVLYQVFSRGNAQHMVYKDDKTVIGFKIS